MFADSHFLTVFPLHPCLLFLHYKPFLSLYPCLLFCHSQMDFTVIVHGCCNVVYMYIEFLHVCCPWLVFDIFDLTYMYINPCFLTFSIWHTCISMLAFWYFRSCIYQSLLFDISDLTYINPCFLIFQILHNNINPCFICYTNIWNI